MKSPDGYTIYVIDDQSDGDPVKSVVINSNDLQKTQVYWTDLLNMQLLEKSDKEIHLSYGGKQAELTFRKTGKANNFYLRKKSITNLKLMLIFLVSYSLDGLIDRKTAFGRIAFAIPFDDQTKLNEEVTKRNETIIHPLTSLDTPGKATVRVIILSDPNQLEICFVDEEGFSQLSQIDPRSDGILNTSIERDPFQKK